MVISVSVYMAVVDSEFFSHLNIKWEQHAFAGLFTLRFWLPTLLGAGFLWALFHRRGHRPGIVGYAVLAFLVVLVSHVFGLMWSALISGHTTLHATWVVGSLLFLLHGWLTVPVAFVATALFAWWARRRWPTASPSGPWPERSRS